MHLYAKCYKSLGHLLRDAREQKELSQAHVAGRLGLASGQFISNFERGLCFPPHPILKRLIKLYDLEEEAVILLLMNEEERFLKKALHVL